MMLRPTTPIIKALQQCATQVKEVSAQRWHFALQNGRTISCTAQQMDGWLCLDAPLDKTPAPQDCARLLRRNAQLADLSKFTLHPETLEVHLRAELPLAEETETAARITQFCQSFSAAGKHWHDADAQTALPSNVQPSAAALSDLTALCRESGWTVHTRPDGTPVVTLEQHHLALLQPQHDHLLVSTTLGAIPKPDEPGSLACAVFLLTASWEVRMARGCVTNAPQPEARFEIRLPLSPSADELSAALAALTVVARRYAREAEICQHETVARQYLATRFRAL